MKKQKRPIIALVSDAVYPYHRGGKELRYYELARRLTRYAKVHVYTMNWWHGSRAEPDEQVAYHAISPLIPLYRQGRRSIAQALLFSLTCFRMLFRRFDVLEADQIPYFQIFALRIVVAIKRKRLVVTWHEVWGPEYWREYLGSLGGVAWRVERFAMAMPHHIIAASPQTAQALHDIIGPDAAITVAPNGIDLDAVKAAYPDAVSPDIVIVGRLMSHKRVDMLLDAIAILHHQDSPVTCSIVGDGPEREALHDKVQQLKLTASVEFHHDIFEQKQVYSLLKAAKVAVFPSAREGFGIAVLEALACGVPVITTSTPSNLARHLVARSSRGTVCEPSASAIAAEVTRWLSRKGPDPTLACADVDGWLAEYSWEAIADRVAKVLLK